VSTGTKPLRLAFFRPALAHTTPIVGIPYQTGIPLSNGSTLREHLYAAALVGNNGNMIHRMAMIQMLEFDRERSSQINLFRLMNSLGGPAKAADVLNTNFDGLVITMSNILRVDATEPGMAELVRALKIPVWCVGIGLQDSLPEGDHSPLKRDIVDLMHALDEKAALFGVRGNQTLKWLKSVGIRRAQALGCPSMFAYPRNILSISAPKNFKRIITAGHLSLTKNPNSKGTKLMAGLGDTRASYVFQGEHAHFKDLLDTPHLYDEARQELDASVLSEYIEKKCGITPPFNRYYSFGESSAWRQVCAQHDVYVGERIHGGVAAMQAGVPALVLHADVRVQELTKFHGIPSCSLDEFAKNGWRAAVKKHLSVSGIDNFQARYQEVLANFEAAMAHAGLTLKNRIQ